MEKYLVLVILAAPGFIARRVARCLGDKPSKRGEFESVLIYFAYSLASLILTIIVAHVIGMFSINEQWENLEGRFAYPLFSMEFMALSIICSFAVGALWQLKLEELVMKMFNYFNKRFGTNEIFLDGSMLHKLFDDGEDHYLIIEKDNKEIASGFFCGASSSSSERVEVYVSTHPYYTDKLKNARKQWDEDPIKGTYIDITNGVIIKELELPKEWFTSQS